MSSLEVFATTNALNIVCEVIIRYISAMAAYIAQKYSEKLARNNISEISRSQLSNQEIVNESRRLSISSLINGHGIPEPFLNNNQISPNSNPGFNSSQVEVGSYSIHTVLAEVFANQEFAEFVSHLISPISLFLVMYLSGGGLSSEELSLAQELPVRLIIGLICEISSDIFSAAAEESYGVHVLDVDIFPKNDDKLRKGKFVIVVLSSLLGVVSYVHGISLSKI